MDVQDVVKLHLWFEIHQEELQEYYGNLLSVLRNNAQQATSQPVEQPLVALRDYLSQMETAQLSSLQMGVLKDSGVAHLIGKTGADWLNNAVATTVYDPATTLSKIQQANDALSTAIANLEGFHAQAEALLLSEADVALPPGHFKIAIIFKEKAAIDNLRDWKTSGSEWELILQGVAEAVGEKPEDTLVIGLSNGSKLVWLGATAAVTKLLATISKHITGIASDVLAVRMQIEQLRQSKWTTKTMEKEYELLEAKVRKEGMETVEAAVEPLINQDLDGGAKNKLMASVKKMVTFRQDGGALDFVKPEIPDEDEEVLDGEAAKIVAEVRQLIEHYQEAEQEQKRLMNKAD